LDPLKQPVGNRAQLKLLHKRVLQEERQVGGHLGISQRTVVAAGNR
jgi:hypothetical protein